MSLFKARDWWVANVGASEEFDGGALCVGNLDNDPNETVKIAVGSLSGHLRIYQPRHRDYRPEDLLLEQELEQAILQLGLGRFSTAGGLQLAVLHPRKLVVYSVQNVGAQYLQLNKLYEHYMEHTAANMCYGPFGGVQGYDYICVQSYDGQLSVFECESFAFARYLPGFLIPGPIAYIEPADAFVTCSASFELECYKFKTLAAASGDKQEEKKTGPAVSLQVGKRVTADWKVVLGESAVDIQCGRLSQGLQPYQADIIVLCEHHIFIVSSTNATIMFQKRLEYHPAACCTYAAPGAKLPGGPENLLVASHNKALHVYRGNVLCWAARTDTQPVAVRVADIMTNTGQGLMRGMVVTLDDKGTLVVSYLGTDPMLNPVGFVEGKELDYEAMGREQRMLAAIIREHTSGRRAEPPDRLAMRAQVPSVFDHIRGGAGVYGASLSDEAGSDGEEDGAAGYRSLGGSGRPGTHRGARLVTVKLYLTYQGGGGSVDNVTLTIRAPEPVTLEVDTIVLREVRSDASDPTVVPLTFQAASSACLPSSNTALVIASFTTSSGEPRAQQLEVALPLCLFAGVVPPVKNAAFKITISANRTPPQLSALFQDLMALAPPGVAQQLMSGGAAANVLSLHFATGVDATIIVSKSGGRYRIQSDAFEALWLVVSELVRRLREYYERAEEGSGTPPEGPLAIGVDDPLPLDDFMEVVDQHFNARQHVSELRKQLEERATMLRSIQKRLLMRFKDKAPSPLNQLDFLMEETYSSIMELGTLIEAAQAKVKAAAQKLGASVQLMLHLISLKFSLPPEEVSVLRSALSPEVADGEETGWEEATEAGMTQLLRSVLARNAKEAAVSIGPLAPAKDTAKLKKHLSLVLERLARGQRMALEGDDLGHIASPSAASTAGPSMARQIGKVTSARVR